MAISSLRLLTEEIFGLEEPCEERTTTVKRRADHSEQIDGFYVQPDCDPLPSSGIFKN
ncbi:MAG: hypothetical protein P8M30_07815 [Planctomycetaceae bacterium]|nr:hypothetical protein [Planctomycetaceae bacterium]